MMEFRFEVLIQRHDALEVVEMNAMRLLEAFEDRYSGAGPSIGIDLRKRVLEVGFSAAGESLEVATEQARRMLLDVADAAGLESIDLVSFVGEPESVEQALAS
jgi:hypothetical protein